MAQEADAKEEVAAPTKPEFRLVDPVEATEHHDECLKVMEQLPSGWTLWLQTGPSDEIMCVHEERQIVIGESYYSSLNKIIYEYKPFFMQREKREKCGWVPFWNLDKETV